MRSLRLQQPPPLPAPPLRRYLRPVQPSFILSLVVYRSGPPSIPPPPHSLALTSMPARRFQVLPGSDMPEDTRRTVLSIMSRCLAHNASPTGIAQKLDAALGPHWSCIMGTAYSLSVNEGTCPSSYPLSASAHRRSDTRPCSLVACRLPDLPQRQAPQQLLYNLVQPDRARPSGNRFRNR